MMELLQELDMLRNKELELYEQKRILESLKYSRQQAQQYANQPFEQTQPLIPYEDQTEVVTNEAFVLALIIGVIGGLVAIGKTIGPNPNILDLMVIFSFGIFILAFWAVVCSAVAIVVMYPFLAHIRDKNNAQRRATVDCSNNKIMIKNREIEARNKRVREQRLCVLANYTHQISMAENQLRENQAILSQLYSRSAVHKDYYGLVPVTMLYSYIDQGRCYELKGPDGAYNLYKKELYLNIIISSLHDILADLKKIRENQALLADSLWQVENHIGSLMHQANQELNQINRNNSNINQCAALASYYAQCSERNTRYLAAAKFWHS